MVLAFEIRPGDLLELLTDDLEILQIGLFLLGVLGGDIAFAKHHQAFEFIPGVEQQSAHC